MIPKIAAHAGGVAVNSNQPGVRTGSLSSHHPIKYQIPFQKDLLQCMAATASDRDLPDCRFS